MKNNVYVCAVWIGAVLCMILAGTLVPPGPVSAQEAEACWFTPAHDAVLFAAPVFTVIQQIAVVQEGARYAVWGQAPEYLWIQYDVETHGYVKRNQGTLSGTCAMNIPVISAPLMAHPTLCVLNTPVQPVPLFADAALQIHVDTLRANASYAVVQQSGTSYYVYLDEYTGGWVAANAGTVSGACEMLPAEPMLPAGTAIALENARLWSAPDVYQGAVLVTLETGSQVAILAGPVSGPISYSSDVEGEWYRVRWGTVTGWAWSERLTIMTGPTDPYRAAVALQNARAWSHPDVKTGTMLAPIPAGTRLQTIAGPVRGPIRYDTDATGDWYQVSVNGTVLGWVWDQRLSFSAG